MNPTGAMEQGVTGRTKLFNRGFFSLLVTQFFGAANDNVLKQVLTFMIATGIWSGGLQDGGLGTGGQVVPALLLTLPFILLSGIAGQVADRMSKRTVMVLVKIAEIPIVAIAMLGFLMQNLWVTLGAMLLLAVQSTFFGPAKYGVIPELVGDDELSRANGLLNMLTNIAIIVGSLLAGPLCDWYAPVVSGAEAKLWAPGAALLAIAILGLGAVLFMPRLPAQDSDLQYNLNPFATYIVALREMARGPLIIVAFAWAFFYMLGMMALLILPEYQRILDISYTHSSYLLGALGISIGIGSVTAGLVSGRHIRPILIPIGASGMTLMFLLLGILPPTYFGVATLLFLAGFFAGFYIIPLQALLQKLSPDDERGRFLGTANGLSFCFSSFGACFFWILTNQLGMPANRVFIVCGIAALVGTSLALWRLRGYIARHATV